MVRFCQPEYARGRDGGAASPPLDGEFSYYFKIGYKCLRLSPRKISPALLGMLPWASVEHFQDGANYITSFQVGAKPPCLRLNGPNENHFSGFNGQNKKIPQAKFLPPSGCAALTPPSANYHDQLTTTR